MGQNASSAPPPQGNVFNDSFAEKLHNQDGKSIVEAMYGQDSAAAIEIERLVREIEEQSLPPVGEAKPTKSAQAAQEKAVKATRQAQAQADAWLRKQKTPQAPQPPTDDPAPPPPPPVLAVFTGKKAAPKKKTAPPMPVPEFYALLGVGVDATFEEIKKGYRKEALKWHPDKNRDRPDESSERFKRINEAFDTLYDPAKRSDYDAGKVAVQGRLKKIQGFGWSNLADEDDDTLTPFGVKIKKQSWRNHVMFYGRIDDDPEQLVVDDRDPRAPMEKIKLFWRLVGEYAHLEREEGDGRWLQNYVLKVWKDTPSRWPKPAEIQSMNESAQQEWKERRMVYNRRKNKVLLHLEMHEVYLNLPDREEKEIERIKAMRPAYVGGKGLSGGMTFNQPKKKKQFFYSV